MSVISYLGSALPVNNQETKWFILLLYLVYTTLLSYGKNHFGSTEKPLSLDCDDSISPSVLFLVILILFYSLMWSFPMTWVIS